jgi:hypothetical protein
MLRVFHARSSSATKGRSRDRGTRGDDDENEADFMPLAFNYVIQVIMIYFRLVSTSVAADNMRVNRSLEIDTVNSGQGGDFGTTA